MVLPRTSISRAPTALTFIWRGGWFCIRSCDAIAYRRVVVNVERAKYILWAADLPRAVNFYRTAFNAEILRQSDVLSEISIAGAVIGLHGGGEGKRTWTGLSFQVADVVEGAREIIAAGGQLLREPMSDAAGEPPHLAMCADTEGNEFMLTRKR
jgi:lactoylglutathione lyase